MSYVLAGLITIGQLLGSLLGKVAQHYWNVYILMAKPMIYIHIYMARYLL